MRAWRRPGVRESLLEKEKRSLEDLDSLLVHEGFDSPLLPKAKQLLAEIRSLDQKLKDSRKNLKNTQRKARRTVFARRRSGPTPSGPDLQISIYHSLISIYFYEVFSMDRLSSVIPHSFHMFNSILKMK